MHGGSGMRIRLAAGTGPVGWLLYWIVLVPVSAILVGCTVAVWSSEVAPVGFVLSVPTLALVLFTAWVGIASYQSAFYLENATLVQRRIWGGARRWDLSTASIVPGHSKGSLTRGRGPVLFISGPGAGRLVLGLRRPDPGQAPVPPRDLLALAHAIAPGSEYAPARHALADQLRQRAHSPFGSAW